MTTTSLALGPLTILSPPDAVPPDPPATTRHQVLPFGTLTWENFERLCHRLCALDGDVDYCARYGQQGEAQEGIDIFARLADGHYHCLQAKRHHKFNASKLGTAVKLFLAGRWAARASRFTIAVQASLQATSVQDAVEKQATALAARGITFVVLDGDALTERLRAHPRLVDDFFGRHWVVAVLGQEVADQLGARLDGAEFARLRAQLASVYRADFHFVDPGSFGSLHDDESRPALTLLERFLKPDILVLEAIHHLESAPIGADATRNAVSAADSSQTESSRGARTSDMGGSGRTRRLPLAEWFGEAQRLVVLGDAGCGKSTLLRVIALDLLHDQEHFPELAARWGEHIPIYIPFALWCSHAARNNSAIGIAEIVRHALEQMLHGSSILDLLDRAINEQRVVLLVDGLDEWANAQAARTTLRALVTVVDAHHIPVIVSGRPRGLNNIGSLPANWKRGTVAPLSALQQAAIAGRWFGRYATEVPSSAVAAVADQRTGPFMAELARDANLGTLATVPLLLIGLVTLALRGQILPRTKNEIYDQLVRTLLEVHPNRRATASGDIVPRFRHATDPTQRRAAIARLAFEVRLETGGAGLSLEAARNVLRNYLTSAEGFELAKPEATAAADEILSVNAETQGLIVEKTPGVVGFVHASFEEFLGAEYVCGWPFDAIESFVRAHAGEGRWRNVIANVLGLIQRRNEFDQLVSIIEAEGSDQVTRYHRKFLLGDIAFVTAMRWTTTARRLALATMDRIEEEEWMPARREALASVLKGLAEPTLKADVERRLAHWMPARSSYRRAGLIEVLGTWKPTPQLQALLLRAMYDEEPRVKRAAAAAYSKAFSHSSEACQRLVDGLAHSQDLASAAALLECLALGWPNSPEAVSLFNQAWRTGTGDLALVGILGLATTGAIPEDARDAVLRGQHVWSDVSYEYRELAAKMLMKYWPGDETLIQSALRRLSHEPRTLWEYGSAIAYLLESPLDHSAVRAWIVAEFRRTEYPFNTSGDQRIWQQIGRFAAADPDVRAAANAYWSELNNRLVNMPNLPSYVASVADPSVAAVLIDVLGTKGARFDRYWALSALLTGWGRDHPAVKQAIDELAESPDEDLDELVSFFPEIIKDKAAARARLLRMSLRPGVRRDLLARGLEDCGCDGSDDAAVEAILAFPEQQRKIFDPSFILIRSFGAHAGVRTMAVELLREPDAPLGAIAAAYPDDIEIGAALVGAATPLPVELRTQVVEVAATGATGTALEGMLEHAMLESDPELRVRMLIARYRALPSHAYATARQALLAQATVLGPDLESMRAAALVGLTMIGELGALSSLEERGKPVILETGGLIERIPTLERLVCERFAEFEAAFGATLHERFTSLGGGQRLAAILSVAPSASPAAKAAFLLLAEQGDIPREAISLRSLAAERPGSELLLRRCWETLGSDDRNNNSALLNADVGFILRDHFLGNAGIRPVLVERFAQSPSAASAIPLAIFAPSADELPFPVEAQSLGRDFGDWAVAVQVAACRADSVSFCKLLEAMVTRRGRSQFDAQRVINLAVAERLQRDAELEVLLTARIRFDIDPSISCSFARYLATTGRLNADALSQVLEMLGGLSSNQRLPVGAFDAIADQWRAIRAILLDAVSAGLELS
ncbi:NACHT domain-containing protein [Rugamonas sp. A1-17]|nr:NACHT domain-containing protein [Rugamonas sp. A1-17]